MKSTCSVCNVLFNTKKLLKFHTCVVNDDDSLPIVEDLTDDILSDSYQTLDLDVLRMNPQSGMLEVKKRHDLIDLTGKMTGVTGTIRITPDKMASVYDIIKAFNTTVNERKTWSDVKKNHFVGVTKSYTYTFPGKGQNKTPVLDSKGVIQLIMVLPGSKAASCRKEFADIIVRYLGGDLSLCYDVIQINQQRKITASKEPEHFFASIANNTYTIINKLRDQCNIKPLPLANLIGTQGIYIASVGVEKDTIVFKYGETDFDVNSRIDKHLGRYKSIGDEHFGPAVVPLYFRKTLMSRRAEKDIKRELHYRNLHLSEGHKISDELKGNDELFILRNNYTMPQVIEIVDYIIDQYELETAIAVDDHQEIRNHEYRMKQLDVEMKKVEEKTKQLELEVELLKLKIQLKSE